MDGAFLELRQFKKAVQVKQNEKSPTLFHLIEADQDLKKLIAAIQQDHMSDDELAMDMGHLYHHLNSAWNSRAFRTLDDPVLLERFYELSKFPASHFVGGVNICNWGGTVKRFLPVHYRCTEDSLSVSKLSNLAN